MDYILLVSEQTKYDIEHKPNKTKKITEHFSLYSFYNKELSKYKLKIPNMSPISLEKYDKKSIYLIPSRIYNDVYYPLEDFEKCYRTDLKNVVISSAIKMGAKYIELVFSDEKDYKISDQLKAGATANIYAKDPETNTGISSGSGIDYKKENFKGNYHKYSFGSKLIIKDPLRISKEEFALFLEAENINIYGLEEFLQQPIETYKKYGTIMDIEYNERTLDNVEKLCKNCFKIYSDIKTEILNIEDFISSSFGFNMESIEEEKSKWDYKFRVSIKF
ncbi:hypothetical protein [Brachyspira innocens]|uniref:hypothetical protein n=1 Tax=Brachyspira innocens TaxID=13264 RepID=UPI0026F34F29|nr:hypothetical protein [Brachyspira innocens]